MVWHIIWAMSKIFARIKCQTIKEGMYYSTIILFSSALVSSFWNTSWITWESNRSHELCANNENNATKIIKMAFTFIIHCRLELFYHKVNLKRPLSTDRKHVNNHYAEFQVRCKKALPIFSYQKQKKFVQCIGAQFAKSQRTKKKN